MKKPTKKPTKMNPEIPCLSYAARAAVAAAREALP